MIKLDLYYYEGDYSGIYPTEQEDMELLGKYNIEVSEEKLLRLYEKFWGYGNSAFIETIRYLYFEADFLDEINSNWAVK